MSAAPRTKISPSTLGGILVYVACWIAVSIGIHVVLIFIGFGVGGLPFAGTGGVGDGDGLAGTSVEMEIAGPQSLTPQGAVPAGHSAEPPQPEIPEQQPQEQSETQDLDGDVAIVEEAQPEPQEERERQERRPPQRELPDQGDPEAPEVAMPGAGQEPAGTDSNDSAAGTPGGDPTEIILGAAGALGNSSAGDRALLPSFGMCSDPVVGTWRSQKYRAGEWVRFILRVERDGERVRGTITSRIWTGSPADPRPRCGAFGFDNTWVMDATGRWNGSQLTFESSRARLVEQHCAGSGQGYAPDNFRGTVDPMRDTYAAINNDGAYDIDEPYTFRRTSCE